MDNTRSIEYEIGYKQQCEHCQEKDYWRYSEAVGAVVCADCGNIVFDGVEADYWAYDNGDGEDGPYPHQWI